MLTAIVAVVLAALPIEPPPTGTDHGPPPINTTINRSGVMTCTGDFTLTASDARTRTLEFVRTYNSMDTRASTFGRGWTHNFAIHLVDPGDSSGAVILVGAQGRSDRYTTAGDRGFNPPPGVVTMLSASGDEGFVAVAQNQSRLQFDERGRLVAELDRFGEGPRLTYDDSSGVLMSVDDGSGSSLTFAYDPDTLRLMSVDDGLGAADDSPSPAVTYSYDPLGRLTSVVRRSGASTSYTYDGDSARLMTVIDPNGNNVMTNMYDAMGRVASQSDAVGFIASYTYTPVASGGLLVLTTGPTTSADPNWHVLVEETFDSRGWLTKRTVKPTPRPAEWQTTQAAY